MVEAIAGRKVKLVSVEARSVEVAIEDVFAEFGFGETTPQAVKDFLSYAYHNWDPPSPRYVVLLGDATYDYKDYMKTGVSNRVPPLMVKTSYLWTTSDPTYASVNGEDLLPDLAIGRLPAATVDEARTMVEKIVAYETGDVSLDGLTVLIADNADRAGDFHADAEELASGVLAGRDFTEGLLERARNRRYPRRHFTIFRRGSVAHELPRSRWDPFVGFGESLEHLAGGLALASDAAAHSSDNELPQRLLPLPLLQFAVGRALESRREWSRRGFLAKRVELETRRPTSTTKLYCESSST